MSIVPKFAVIIVLDNECVPPFCPLQQSDAPCQRKNGPSRELVRGRHKRQTSTRWELCGINAIAIHCCREQLRSGGAQYFPGPLVPWIFDSDSMAALDQHSSNQIEGLLGTVHNNDLRRIADYGAGPSQMGADGLSQGRIPASITIVQTGYRPFARAAQQNAPPHFKWEAFEVTSPVGEVVGQGTRAPLREIHPRPGCCSARSKARKPHRGTAFLCRRVLVPELRGNIGARSGSPDDESFGQELIVGEEHHGPRNSELLGQIARRWKSLVRTKRPT